MLVACVGAGKCGRGGPGRGCTCRCAN